MLRAARPKPIHLMFVHGLVTSAHHKLRAANEWVHQHMLLQYIDRCPQSYHASCSSGQICICSYPRCKPVQPYTMLYFWFESASTVLMTALMSSSCSPLSFACITDCSLSTSSSAQSGQQKWRPDLSCQHAGQCTARQTMSWSNSRGVIGLLWGHWMLGSCSSSKSQEP